METIVLGGPGEATATIKGISFGASSKLGTAAELLTEFNDILAAFQPRVLPKPPEFRPRKVGKFLYMPVTDASDLEPRLALAGVMRAKGWQCLVGTGVAISRQRFGHLPPGIVLFPGRTANDAKQMFQAEQTGGHLCVALEGGPVNEWAALMCDEMLPGLPMRALARTPRRTVICTSAPLVNDKDGFRIGVLRELTAYGRAITIEEADTLRARITAERAQLDATLAYLMSHANTALFVHVHEGASRYMLANHVEPPGSIYATLATAERVICARDSEAWRIAGALGVSRETFGGDVGEAAQPSDSPIDELTIAQKLHNLWQRHQYPMPFDLVTAWGGRALGADEVPLPAYPSKSHDALAGCAVRALNPAAWAVMPGGAPSHAPASVPA